jgi:hypothetical protein
MSATGWSVLSSIRAFVWRRLRFFVEKTERYEDVLSHGLLSNGLTFEISMCPSWAAGHL